MKPGWVIYLGLVVAGCGDLFEPDPAPQIMTNASHYNVRVTDMGYETSTPIGYVFTNPSPDSVYFVNCRGDVRPHLETFIFPGWQPVWAPVKFSCLSAPIKVPGGQQYTDSVRPMGGTPSSNFSPKFSMRAGTHEYRLVWSQVLTSYDPDSRPFGEDLPLEHRVSNSFTMTLVR